MADGRVEIELELDDGKVKPQADKAGRKAGDDFGGSFVKNAGGKLGALAATVEAAGAAATVAVAKAAVEAFSQYEQLAGGVEKIFDQADQERIFRDAQEAYLDLNMSANKYLEVINQTGAAFASTMGDQAGYDAARKGLKAISDYASGTGRSIDELSEKFTLITRSTSSYQSIADQFSGVLPATSAAFLEQAQAAGYLSDEYSKLTEVPIDEYQMAVTEMLELGVDQLGLAGNTAAETASTISGSLAATTAAWENWLVGLADDTADIQALTNNLVEAAAMAAANIVPRVGQVVASVGSLLATELPKLLESLVQTISNDSVAISTAALEYFLELAGAIVKATPDILKALLLLIASIIVAIGNKAGEFFTKGVEAIKELSKGVKSGFSFVLSEIGRGLSEGLDKIKSFARGFFDAGKNIIEGLKQGIVNAVMGLAGAAANAATSALNAVKRVLGINSPSKRAFELGEFFTEGLELGVLSKKSSLSVSVGNVASDMLAAVTPKAALAGASSATTTYTFGDVHLNASDAYGITAIEQLVNLIETA